MHSRVTLFLLAALAGALAFAAPPKPVESEYLRSTGGGFMVEDGLPYYAMNFEIIKALPDGFHLRFLFENPRKKESEITETRRLDVEGNSIIVQSVLLECIGNNRRYLVTVEVYSDDSEKRLITRHKQKIEFSLPSRVIEQFDISIC